MGSLLPPPPLSLCVILFLMLFGRAIGGNVSNTAQNMQRGLVVVMYVYIYIYIVRHTLP